METKWPQNCDRGVKKVTLKKNPKKHASATQYLLNRCDFCVTYELCKSMHRKIHKCKDYFSQETCRME